MMVLALISALLPSWGEAARSGAVPAENACTALVKKEKPPCDDAFKAAKTAAVANPQLKVSTAGANQQGNVLAERARAVGEPAKKAAEVCEGAKKKCEESCKGVDAWACDEIVSNAKDARKLADSMGQTETQSTKVGDRAGASDAKGSNSSGSGDSAGGGSGGGAGGGQGQGGSGSGGLPQSPSSNASTNPTANTNSPSAYKPASTEGKGCSSPAAHRDPNCATELINKCGSADAAKSEDCKTMFKDACSDPSAQSRAVCKTTLTKSFCSDPKMAQCPRCLQERGIPVTSSAAAPKICDSADPIYSVPALREHGAGSDLAGNHGSPISTGGSKGGTSLSGAGGSAAQLGGDPKPGEKPQPESGIQSDGNGSVSSSSGYSSPVSDSGLTPESTGVHGALAAAGLGRGVASDEGESAVTDVAPAGNGFSVLFSILEEVFRERCRFDKLHHCPRGKK